MTQMGVALLHQWNSVSSASSAHAQNIVHPISKGYFKIRENTCNVWVKVPFTSYAVILP